MSPGTADNPALILWIAGFSLLGSIGAIGGASLFLLFPEGIRRHLIPGLVSYAAGTLLAAAFLGMLPAALSMGRPDAVSATVLGGIVLFFLLEKVVLWRHSHHDGQDARRPAGPLILIGDATHNFVDGVMIAAAFLSSVPLGIATALAVIAHEIPQEVGDFAILLDSGYERTTALALNALSAAATLPGAVLAYFWLGEVEAAKPYILALAAASFIYIAVADLIPGLNRQASPGASVLQTTLILAGIGTIMLFQPGG